MRFSSFDQFKKSFPKIAVLMEDSDSGTFVQSMKAKVENGEDLTVKMRRALEKIASEQAAATDVDIPDVGKHVALKIEIFQNKTETKRSGIEQPVLEFKTNFGVRGRLQLDDDDDLMRAVKDAGMEDEDDKGSLHIEVEAELVWKKNTFIILSNLKDWGTWNVAEPPHSGMIRKIPPGKNRISFAPSTGDSEPDPTSLVEVLKEEEPKPPKPRRPRRERPKTEIDRLQQRAEDAAEDWEKALDFK